MSLAICQQCKTDFEKSPANDLSICAACEEKIKADIKILKDVKQLFGAFVFIAIGMFIPLVILPMVKGADSSGYYEFKDKTTAIYSFNGLVVLNVLNTVALTTFFSLYIFFKNKLLKKEADYYNSFDKENKRNEFK